MRWPQAAGSTTGSLVTAACAAPASALVSDTLASTAPVGADDIASTGAKEPSGLFEVMATGGRITSSLGGGGALAQANEMQPLANHRALRRLSSTPIDPW